MDSWVIVVHCLTASPPQVWTERVKTGVKRVKAGRHDVPRRVVVAEERVVVVRGFGRRLHLISIVGVVEAQNYNRRAERAQQAPKDLARLLCLMQSNSWLSVKERPTALNVGSPMASNTMR